MTGPEHYRMAEYILDEAKKFMAESVAEASVDEMSEIAAQHGAMVAQAQVHATLALAAPKPLPVVEIRRPHDEIIDLFIDGREVASANHDDHGWSGMAAFEKLAVTLVRAFGSEITEVEANEDDDDE